MRRTELDLCRILGCLAVLVIHAGAEIYHELPLESLSFAAVNLISTAVRGGVPLFFMLSGALLLGREELDPGRFFRRHVLRLAGVFCLWSLLYALLRLATGSLSGAHAFFMAWAGGHYHLWFLPAMVLCDLFLPVVHAALHGRKLDGRYPVGLFLFLGIVLANCNLTPDPAYILHRITENFSLDYLPYLGYAVWGWRLDKRAWPRKTLWLAPAVFLLTTLLAAAGNRWYSGYKETADGWLFSYFSLPSFLQATSVFCFCLALRDHPFRRAKALAALSDAALGVYLIHPLVLHLLKRAGLTVTSAGTLLGVSALLAALCFPLVLLVRRVPGLRKLL